MWHVEPVQFVLRKFAPGKVYGKDEYETIVTVFVCGDVGVIFGMHGEIDRNDWLELQAKLKAMGVVDLLAVRHRQRVWYETETGKIVARRRVTRHPTVDPGIVVTPGS